MHFLEGRTEGSRWLRGGSLSQLGGNSEPSGDGGPEDEKPGGTGRLVVAKINGAVGDDGISPHGLGRGRAVSCNSAPLLRPMWLYHRRASGENTRRLPSSVNRSAGLFWVLSRLMEGQPCQEHTELCRPCRRERSTNIHYISTV